MSIICEFRHWTQSIAKGSYSKLLIDGRNIIVADYRIAFLNNSGLWVLTEYENTAFTDVVIYDKVSNRKICAIRNREKGRVPLLGNPVKSIQLMRNRLIAPSSGKIETLAEFNEGCWSLQDDHFPNIKFISQ